MHEISDTMSDKNFGDVNMEIIDESLVVQWNPNFFSAILLKESEHKVDETSSQETYTVNTKEEMNRYKKTANPFVRLWPYYENNFFVQRKDWAEKEAWTMKEYQVEPLGLFSQQQYIKQVRTLNFPNYEYTSLYTHGYDVVIFTYADWNDQDKNGDDVDVFQIYQCYSDGNSCTKHYEYSIVSDYKNKEKLKFANQYVHWERSTDMHEFVFLTQHIDTDEYFISYLRLYLKWADPIVFELHEIPLYTNPLLADGETLSTWVGTPQTDEPVMLQEYNGNLLYQMDTANEVYMMNFCAFDEYIDIEENLCKKCTKNRFSWDP
jgi:hypothetical protein